MLGVHVFIGIGEALITAAALAFIAATRRDLLDLRPDRAAALARRTAATGDGSATAGTPVAGGSLSHDRRGRAHEHDARSRRPTPTRSRIGRWWWVVGIAIAALVVIVLAPLASPDPDGLERVAEDQGFIERAQNFFSGLLGDYAIPGIDNEWLSTVLAGLLGVADRRRDRAHPRPRRRAPPRPG